jgi:hypothetical protein
MSHAYRAAFLGLTISVAAVCAQTFPTDPYRCYPARNATPVTASVVLRDALNPLNSEPVDIRATVRFCNPVEQSYRGFKTEIIGAEARQAMYMLSPRPEPVRNVTVSNQFGTYTIVVQSPAALAAASWLHGSGTASADNFQCYNAGGAAIEQRWGLRDGNFRGSHEVLFPMLFCASAELEHNGAITPPRFPEVHMACYSITKAHDRFEASLSADNLFGPQAMTVISGDLFCVPTLMLGVQ